MEYQAGQDLLLGIDIGTYESKGILTTTNGRFLPSFEAIDCRGKN